MMSPAEIVIEGLRRASRLFHVGSFDHGLNPDNRQVFAQRIAISNVMAGTTPDEQSPFALASVTQLEAQPINLMVSDSLSQLAAVRLSIVNKSLDDVQTVLIRFHRSQAGSTYHIIEFRLQALADSQEHSSTRRLLQPVAKDQEVSQR